MLKIGCQLTAECLIPPCIWCARNLLLSRDVDFGAISLVFGSCTRFFTDSVTVLKRLTLQDSLTGVIQGFIRVYMHILSPISMRQTESNSLYDAVSRANGKDELSDSDAGVQTTKLCVPRDFTGLVNVTR